MQICAGEVRQHAMRYRYAADVDGYMRWIHDKTATLLAACCDIGAVLGDLRPEARAALHHYGVWLGLAFQIADDVLDYTGSEDKVGKPIGHDLVEGFATLPLMLALNEGSRSAALRELLVDGRAVTTDEARRITDLVRESGAIEVALRRARELSTRARAELAHVPDAESSRTLAALTEYVVSRTF